MCKCKIDSRKLEVALNTAKAKEVETKKKFGVYTIENPKTKEVYLFVAEVSKIKKNKEACCYMDTNGKQVVIEVKKAKKTIIKDDKKV